MISPSMSYSSSIGSLVSLLSHPPSSPPPPTDQPPSPPHFLVGYSRFSFRRGTGRSSSQHLEVPSTPYRPSGLSAQVTVPVSPALSPASSLPSHSAPPRTTRGPGYTLTYNQSIPSLSPAPTAELPTEVKGEPFSPTATLTVSPEAPRRRVPSPLPPITALSPLPFLPPTILGVIPSPVAVGKPATVVGNGVLACGGSSSGGAAAAIAPCDHVKFWRRLRTKKGIDHLLCAHCGLKWKTPHHQMQDFVEMPYFTTSPSCAATSGGL